MEVLFEIKNVIFEDQIIYPELTLKENEITFLKGESGCGKSTLFKLLNGLVSPSQGTILFQGTDIQKMDTIQLRRQVLLATQSACLFSGSIEDNFRIYYDYRDQTPPSQEEIKKFLADCCIFFPTNHDCSNLSGGERQRIFLAICISFCPRVLLLDEPTSALDPETGRALLKNMIKYCRQMKITLMVISHDQLLTEEFADRVITLDKRRNKE